METLSLNGAKLLKKTNLASAKYLGTLDMFSIPPATTTSLMPNCILCAASIVAAKIYIVALSYKQVTSLGPYNIYINGDKGSLGNDLLIATRRCTPFIPDAQTLLTVVQITVLGSPAPNAACLAGACPKFALRTLPKKTSSTSDGSTCALLIAPKVALKREITLCHLTMILYNEQIMSN